jgi:hypothetical protein
MSLNLLQSFLNFVAVDVGLKIELLNFLHFVKFEAHGGSPLFQWQYTGFICERLDP